MYISNKPRICKSYQILQNPNYVSAWTRGMITTLTCIPETQSKSVGFSWDENYKNRIQSLKKQSHSSTEVGCNFEPKLLFDSRWSNGKYLFFIDLVPLFPPWGCKRLTLRRELAVLCSAAMGATSSRNIRWYTLLRKAEELRESSVLWRPQAICYLKALFSYHRMKRRDAVVENYKQVRKRVSLFKGMGVDSTGSCTRFAGISLDLAPCLWWNYAFHEHFHRNELQGLQWSDFVVLQTSGSTEDEVGERESPASPEVCSTSSQNTFQEQQQCPFPTASVTLPGPTSPLSMHKRTPSQSKATGIFSMEGARKKEAMWDLFQSECMFLYDHLMVLKNVSRRYHH